MSESAVLQVRAETVGPPITNGVCLIEVGSVELALAAWAGGHPEAARLVEARRPEHPETGDTGDEGDRSLEEEAGDPDYGEPGYGD